MRIPAAEKENRSMSTMSDKDVDFSEYMWMGEELEEFDRKVEHEFWEDVFIEACFEEMYEEEDEDVYFPDRDRERSLICDIIENERRQKLGSSLNPEAAEFVPRSACSDRSELAEDGALR